MQENALTVTRYGTARRTEAIHSPFESFYQSFLKCDLSSMAENGLRVSTIVGVVGYWLLSLSTLIASIVLGVLSTIDFQKRKAEGNDDFCCTKIDIAFLGVSAAFAVLIGLPAVVIRFCSDTSMRGLSDVTVLSNSKFFICCITTPILVPYIILRAAFGCVKGLFDYIPKCCPETFETSETIILSTVSVDVVSAPSTQPLTLDTSPCDEATVSYQQC